MKELNLVYCLYCKSLKDVRCMKSTFKTGFIQIQGINYPMGICKREEVGGGNASPSSAQ